MLVLKMVNRHLAKLTREYTATQKGDLRALAIAEELSQVGAGGGEIQRKERRSGQPPRSLLSESPTFETLLRRLDKLARQFAETPREIQASLRSSTRSRGLAFSLTLYSNQGNDAERKAHCERSARRSKADNRATSKRGKKK